MNTLFLRGALAPALLLCAQAAPAHANDMADPAGPIIAAGLRADAHGPAGTMADHLHDAGTLMIGLNLMREDWRGHELRGASRIPDADIAAAGYTSKSDAMTMDMAMIHVMWAPSDRVTLMAVPTWMRMEMTMKGLPGASGTGAHGGHGGHGGHGLDPGETMKHSVEGWGDTQFGALVSLSRRPALSAHAGLMVSAPTGKVDRRNADGRFVHYMMQGGSGTWDLLPSLTVHGLAGDFGWGAQASYVFRAEKANASGFRVGDRFAATAWASHAVTPRASVSARLAYSWEGRIMGHYNAAHNHSSPPDRQPNYGGKRIDAGLGGNLVLGDRLRLGIEGTAPLWQRVNGIQTPRRFGASANIAVMF